MILFQYLNAFALLIILGLLLLLQQTHPIFPILLVIHLIHLCFNLPFILILFYINAQMILNSHLLHWNTILPN